MALGGCLPTRHDAFATSASGLGVKQHNHKVIPVAKAPPSQEQAGAASTPSLSERQHSKAHDCRLFV